MEVGSGSSSTSNFNNTNNANSDRDGLKFGKKIYFEAAGGGGGGSGRPPPAPGKKGRREAAPGGPQPPRCQVEGCKIDLSDAKTYYSRHKVCGTHSKSPQVIVGGLHQRFCQQCSRFHQLPEFDQGKRSCRRRLAGHNERRRKPQPGSLLSSRIGSLSSSLFETSSRPGSFLMDFSSYSSLSGRDLWPNVRTSQRAASNQPTALGKSLQHPWQNNHESPPELLMQGSVSRGATTYVPSGVSSVECCAGVSDSSRALSLLSTQSWDTRNQSSSLGMNGLLRPNGTPVVRPSGFLGEAQNYFLSSPWGFKGCENNRSSHENPPNLGLGHLSQAASNQYASDFNASHQLNGRECLGLEYSRGYESSVQNMHRPL